MEKYVEVQVKSSQREEMIDLTPLVKKVIANNSYKDGICLIFVPHTTCGVTINENADPDVIHDLTAMLSKIVPQKASYQHLEGNSDAHIKSSIIGPSQQVIVSEGRLCLGTWQGVFLCEFDGPRQRKVWIKLL